MLRTSTGVSITLNAAFDIILGFGNFVHSETDSVMMIAVVLQLRHLHLQLPVVPKRLEINGISNYWAKIADGWTADNFLHWDGTVAIAAADLRPFPPTVVPDRYEFDVVRELDVC